MLVLNIPDWVILFVCMFVYIVAITTFEYNITIYNWREKLRAVKNWVLDKYSNYRYPYRANYTVVANVHYNIVVEKHNERYNWIRENIEDCHKSVWATTGKCVINVENNKTIEPTHFAFKFRKREDLTLYLLAWYE